MAAAWAFARETSRYPTGWWRRGPPESLVLPSQHQAGIHQTATEQPRQQTNACFLLISALWWKKEGRGGNNPHPRVAGRNGVSTHVTQSASFSLSPLQAGMSEGRKKKEKNPGVGVGGRRWRRGVLVFCWFARRQQLCVCLYVCVVF